MLKPPGVHGTNECSQPASKSSWDSQDFGDVSMVLKNGPQGHNELMDAIIANNGTFYEWPGIYYPKEQ